MKLSDAVLLGSTLIKPMGGVLHRRTWITGTNDVVEYGCAVGMVLKALGRELGPPELENISLPVFLSQQLPEYPWLIKPFTNGSRCCPEGCGTEVETPLSMIVHLFDHHVCNRIDTPKTLSSLIEYIKTIEPEEVASVEEPEEKEIEDAIQRSDVVGVARNTIHQ